MPLYTLTVGLATFSINAVDDETALVLVKAQLRGWMDPKATATVTREPNGSEVISSTVAAISET